MAKPLTPLEESVNPILSEPIHPDGKPWDKCCGGKDDHDTFHVGNGESVPTCMCLMRKPRNGDSRHTVIISSNSRHLAESRRQLEELAAAGGRFFCVHRSTDDGYMRECGGWARKFKPKEE